MSVAKDGAFVNVVFPGEGVRAVPMEELLFDELEVRVVADGTETLVALQVGLGRRQGRVVGFGVRGMLADCGVSFGHGVSLRIERGTRSGEKQTVIPVDSLWGRPGANLEGWHHPGAAMLLLRLRL